MTRWGAAGAGRWGRRLQRLQPGLRLAGALFTAVPGKTYRLRIGSVTSLCVSSQNQTFLFSGKYSKSNHAYHCLWC